MPRTGKGGNRTDLLAPRPVATAPGQPNGRPVTAKIPNGLPYGEKGTLRRALANTPAAASAPRPPRRPLPPQADGVDYTAPGAMDNADALLGNWQPPQLPALHAPTERPAEPITAGMMGQPDSVLGHAAPGGLADMFDQLAMSSGNKGIADLAARARAGGA